MSKSFRDLVAFKRALEVVVFVYEVSGRFPSREMYGLVAQVRKAAIGIISNIAEGNGRLTYGEWRQFLSQARGSLFEVEAQLIAARELKYIDEPDLSHAQKLIGGTGRALTGLILWVRKRELATAKPRHRATAQPAHRSP
ncbi:MAG TPA: four helix bundle protein [Thermoanaerobaculia bacterium]|nr:four helix bundle protein [Thermoanaerobaculia bacterium]